MRKMEQQCMHCKSAILGITVMALASSLFVSCGKKAEEQAKDEPVKVKEMIVGEGGLTADGSFDGIISEKNAEVGQNAAPGMPIAKLVTTRVLNVKISVPESEMAGIHVRQRAKIQVQALNDRWFNGYVIEKGVIADPITRSYNVKIRVEEATDGLLPGMVSNVSLGKVSSASSGNTENSGNTGNSAIIIPASLVQLGDDNSNFIWVDEGGKAVRRTIVCGEYMSQGVSIVSGLKIGDKLIVEGQQKVCTGTPLKAIVP